MIFILLLQRIFARYDYQNQNVVPCVPDESMFEIIGLKSLSDHKIAILQKKVFDFMIRKLVNSLL